MNERPPLLRCGRFASPIAVRWSIGEQAYALQFSLWEHGGCVCFTELLSTTGSSPQRRRLASARCPEIAVDAVGCRRNHGRAPLRPAHGPGCNHGRFAATSVSSARAGLQPRQALGGPGGHLRAGRNRGRIGNHDSTPIRIRRNHGRVAGRRLGRRPAARPQPRSGRVAAGGRVNLGQFGWVNHGRFGFGSVVGSVRGRAYVPAQHVRLTPHGSPAPC